MAKIIKLTQEIINEVEQEFKDSIRGIKLSDGKLTFSKNIGTVDRKATLYFNELAYFKMITLVTQQDKEVGWHGIAKRSETEEDAYIIEDIMIYPQEVTGANVETDQEQYQTWLMNHDDDVFNNIRMQGHSHVNMATNPSTVDTALYDGILAQLDDTMFYIFLIWNKRGDRWIRIYDMAKNVLFETADVTVKTIDDGTGIQKFLATAKDMVKDRVSTYAKQTTKAATPTPVGYQAKGKSVPATTQTTTIVRKKKSTSEQAAGSSRCRVYDDYDYDDYYDSYYGRGGYGYGHGKSWT